jgi:hypothetical protein
MQTPRTSELDPQTSKLPEYAYRIAILIAIILMIWTVA